MTKPASQSEPSKRSEPSERREQGRTDTALLARENESIRLRMPGPDDGTDMWRMAKDSGVLEENSEYVYYMLSEFFTDSCVIAEVDGQNAGFITGFRPPKQPDSVFVWQIAVDHDFRGRGLAGRMLAELIRQQGPTVRYLEATVTPNNRSSRSAFEGFARRYGADCEQTLLFPAEQFDGPSDEDEILFRIGPIDRTQLAPAQRPTNGASSQRELAGAKS